MEFLPETLPLPMISSEDAVTHAPADITHVLLNPTPTIPLTALGSKNTASLKQLAEIFNMAVTPQDSPPTNSVPQEQKNSTPSLRVDIPEAAPAPPPRVDSPIHLPQSAPQMDDMEPMPPAAHQNSKENPNVSQVHRYNTRAHHLQGQYLMVNHVATIKTPTTAPRNLVPFVRSDVEN